jgi:hypothetical protein
VILLVHKPGFWQKPGLSSRSVAPNKNAEPSSDELGATPILSILVQNNRQLLLVNALFWNFLEFCSGSSLAVKDSGKLPAPCWLSPLSTQAS